MAWLAAVWWTAKSVVHVNFEIRFTNGRAHTCWPPPKRRTTLNVLYDAWCRWRVSASGEFYRRYDSVLMQLKARNYEGAFGRTLPFNRLLDNRSCAFG